MYLLFINFKDNIRNLNYGVTVRKFAFIAISSLFIGRLQKKIIIMGTCQRLNLIYKKCMSQEQI